MPRVNPLLTAFNGGEFGPRMVSRVDFERYRNAAARMENIVVLPQGGWARRPGSRYIAPNKDPLVPSRLIPFEFSTEQAYVIEAADKVFRFFFNKGQISVADTDAAITNGDFQSDISGWSDLSTGSASLQHGTIPEAVDLVQFAQVQVHGWGDVVAGGRHFGLRFQPANSGDVSKASVQLQNVVTNFTARARIYTDNAGSPGTQVGGDSDDVTTLVIGLNEFPFTGVQPAVTGGTNYWIVFSDVSAAGNGNAIMSCCADQGTPFMTGRADTITGITDGSGVGTSIDLRARIDIDVPATQGAMLLVGASDGVAAAEQAVTTSQAGVEHVVAFTILGVPGDSLTLRVGSTSEGDQFLVDTELTAGFHAIGFTPTSSPFYLQFRNAEDKVVSLTAVKLLDNEPFEVETPYAAGDLGPLKWTQSADILYLAQPDYEPYKLERRGGTKWSVVKIAFEDGPYLDQNTNPDHKLDPSAVSGESVAVKATGFAPFKEGDIGRPLRLQNSGEPGWSVIKEFRSSTEVVVSVKRDFPSDAETDKWSLGAWSGDLGYPSAVTFFEQRLTWANSRTRPQTFWMSQSADVENMRPDSFEGSAVEVQDDDALNFTIAADQVNAIIWMSPGRQLILGTSGGEWSVTSDGPVVTPLDIEVKRESTNGSADVLPVRLSSIVLFLQQARRKVREFVYALENDGFRTPDLTILADHITQGGIWEMAYAQEPDSQIYCRRADGQLPVLTYRREEEVVGWGRQILGGSLSGGIAQVESLAVIPGSEAAGTAGTDECWLIVHRTINGQSARYVEVFEPLFEGPNRDQFDDQESYDAAVLEAQKMAFYVDSGLTYDGAPTTVLTGLGHAEGETVVVLGDGGRLPDQVVSGGQITLPVAVSKAVVGLGYRHVYKSLKMAYGAAAGTAVAKRKRIHEITYIVNNSWGLNVGPAMDKLKPVVLRKVKDLMDTPPPLVTGEAKEGFAGEFADDPRVYIAGDDPLPLMLVGMAPELKTNDIK